MKKQQSGDFLGPVCSALRQQKYVEIEKQNNQADVNGILTQNIIRFQRRSVKHSKCDETLTHTSFASSFIFIYLDLLLRK